MRITILGDSWGTPNGLPPHMREDNPHLHLLLEAAGHEVSNFAECAGSNMESMRRWQKHLHRHHGPDWVIWFHTESLRDFSPGPHGFRIREATRIEAQTQYAKFKHLRNKVGCRDIIIGGQAPVLDELLQHTPTLLIRDWRCELLGLESIPTHSVCHDYLFEHELCDDSYEDRLSMLKEHDVILTAKKNSADFPDDCHPGGAAHRALFDRISAIIQ